MRRSARYDWPGNVRELQNVLASLAVRTARRGVVPPAALGPQFADERLADALRLDDARRTFEQRFVRAALVRTGGHRARAAAELGVTRQGLTKLSLGWGSRERPVRTAERAGLHRILMFSPGWPPCARWLIDYESVHDS